MKNKFTKTIILTLFPFVSVCQINIMTKSWKTLSHLESQLQLGLNAASTGAHFSLKDATVADLSYYVSACEKSKGNKLMFPISCSVIGFKENKNLIWTFYFALIYTKDGRYTDSAYAGYTKTEFGEQTDKYLIKLKKLREYPENNVFTETLIINEEIGFVIEDKIFIRKIIFPDKGLTVKQYYYEDCDN